jgi:hypothetical protein
MDDEPLEPHGPLTLQDTLRAAETVLCMKCLQDVCQDDIAVCGACNAFVADKSLDRRRTTETRIHPWGSN